jgi:6-pyruvoyltetrahydropterin/6-carboxytetrahydropterin synthase
MYTLAVRRDFVAQHALIGGDWGAENLPHSHHYVLELQMEGAELDRHGFLVDIVDVEKNLDALVGRYRDHLLNDLPEFSGLNPSLETFSRILYNSLGKAILAKNISFIKVILWENDTAWASYRIERPDKPAE